MVRRDEFTTGWKEMLWTYKPYRLIFFLKDALIHKSCSNNFLMFRVAPLPTNDAKLLID